MDFKENKDRYILFNETNTFEFNKDLEYWDYLPLKTHFLKPLYTYYNDGDKLLDLGCGPGNILRFAKNIGYDVTGVELDSKFEPYLKGFNYLIKDITELDYNFYKRFNLIYLYQPIKIDLKGYVDKIISNINKGTIIYSPTFIIMNKHVKQIGTFVYKKK